MPNDDAPRKDGYRCDICGATTEFDLCDLCSLMENIRREMGGDSTPRYHRDKRKERVNG